MLMLKCFGKQLLEFSFSFYCLFPQRLFIQFEIGDRFFRLFLYLLTFSLKLLVLPYFFLQIDKNILICWKLFDAKTTLLKKSMSWQYSFIRPNLLFYFVVLITYLCDLFFFIVFNLVDPHLKQLILLLILFGHSVQFIIFIFLFFEQSLSPLLCHSFFFEFSRMFELYFLHLRFKISYFSILLHQFDLVLNMRWCTNSTVSSSVGSITWLWLLYMGKLWLKLFLKGVIISK